jgi:hypothetical protein
MICQNHVDHNNYTIANQIFSTWKAYYIILLDLLMKCCQSIFFTQFRAFCRSTIKKWFFWLQIKVIFTLDVRNVIWLSKSSFFGGKLFRKEIRSEYRCAWKMTKACAFRNLDEHAQLFGWSCWVVLVAKF